jgi:hypothetical protein
VPIRTDEGEPITLVPVEIAARWNDLEGAAARSVTAAFTSWSGTIAQAWIVTTLVSTLGPLSRQLSRSFPEASPLEIAAADAQSIGGVLRRWPEYADHGSRTGSLIDFWTIDPHFLVVVESEIRSALRVLLPPNALAEARLALWDTLVVGVAAACGRLVWRRLTGRNRKGPPPGLPPPPFSVRRRGPVEVEFPNGRRRQWSQLPRPPQRPARRRHSAPPRVI